jgi:D,D-heptose 1,7-bisphosphate phosphatase
VTLFVHPNDHPYDSDIVETDKSDRIVGLHPYPHPSGRDLPNLVNAGLYVVEKRCLGSIPKADGILDFAKHLIPILLKAGKYLSAYRSREYIKDAGTPERLSAVVADIASRRVEEGSLETPAPAVFLDRDGTLIDDPGHIVSPDQVRLFPGVGEAVQRLNRSKYLAVLATNQPVVARGEVDERELKLIHNRLEQILGRDHAYLNAIYCCPHHPDGGFPGERPEYKITCNCRKPASGMIQQAVGDMNIDVAASWMIGDTFTDVETAARADLRSVLLGTGHGGRDGKYPQRPNFEFPTLCEAVDFIIDDWPKVEPKAANIARQLRPGDLVLIGGLARSGKSTFASALAWKLKHLAAAVPKVISLDGWIKPLEERGGLENVVDRYQIELMEHVMSRALVQPGGLDIPVYNRKSRGSDKSYSLFLQPSNIVILEGVVALLLNLQSPRRVVRIYISREEQLRRSIMAADYRSRQFTDEEFEKLYAERRIDETPFIVGTRDSADIVVESE